jgi:hypothetical protein
MVFWEIKQSNPLKANRRFGEHVASIFRVAEHLLAACFHAVIFFGLFFDHEEGGDMFLRNIG